MLKVGRVRLRLDRGKADKIARDEAYRLTLNCTRRTFNRANVLTPVDTGNLRAHNQMTVGRSPRGAVGWVFNDAAYAEAVHNGSPPHTIRPRKGKALKFQMDGRTVFAKSVRHPGNRGRPWITRAGREVAAQEGFRFSAG